MGDNAQRPSEKTGLNPALKTHADSTHDTSESSPSPAETTSVQREEGRAWPLIWLIVTIIGVGIALWILFL